jgi:hypothetical protein
MSFIGIIIEGWRLILAFILRLLKHLLEYLLKLWESFLERFSRKRKRERRDYVDINCFRPPPETRARPDPSIYSQFWFKLRNIGFTWDNPDFKLIDTATGTAIGRFNLKPDTDYLIQATIHNNSFMAAIGTSVSFEVRGFGAGTSLVSNLGAVVIDVPAGGSEVAEVPWHTPASGGHNCLRAIIFHHDDANPLNNVGQHNTDIARPASKEHSLTFLVGNEGADNKSIHFEMDAYRLPAEAMQAENSAERQSVKYLRRLQEANDPLKQPIPESLNPQLSAERLELKPGEEVEITLSLTPPPRDDGLLSVNVNALEGADLIGGITAYVQAEGG